MVARVPWLIAKKRAMPPTLAPTDQSASYPSLLLRLMPIRADTLAVGAIMHRNGIIRISVGVTALSC
jgi:hypothetical protein